MRVTNNMILSVVLDNVSKMKRRLTECQIQLSSGKRINKPSDDPVGITHVLDLRSSIAKNEQFQRNIEDSRSWLNTTDSTLTQISDLLTEVRAVAVDGANELAERDALAIEVNQSLELLVRLANTKFGGKYIFAGSKYLTAPYATSKEVSQEQFTASFDTGVELDHPYIVSGSVSVTDIGGGTTYTEGVDYTIDYENGTITVLATGSMLDGTTYEINYTTENISSVATNLAAMSGDIKRQIGEETTVKINLSGYEVFNTSINLFDVLIQLRDNLKRDNIEAIKQSLSDIDQAADQVLEASCSIAAIIDRLDKALQLLESEKINLADSLAEIEETDMAEVLLKFQTMEMAFEAALQTGARLVQQSLIDFVR